MITASYELTPEQVVAVCSSAVCGCGSSDIALSVDLAASGEPGEPVTFQVRQDILTVRCRSCDCLCIIPFTEGT